MNENFSLLLSVGIPAIISIVGFIITIYTLKKGFQNELAKQKANIQLDKMAVMPYEILVLMQEMIDVGKQKTSLSVQQKLKEKMDWIFSSIYAYGSSKAIHILATMQSENFQNEIIPENVDQYRIMAYYVLLTVQIRADITGEIVSPEEWFKLKLKDFYANREMIKSANNRLIEDLDLDRRYIMQ